MSACGHAWRRLIMACILLCVASRAHCKSSRCVLVSDVWRNVSPNASQQEVTAGRVFYDSSISQCTAFGPQCEQWVEFRAERGQIQCMHQQSHQLYYARYWESVRLKLLAWMARHRNIIQTVTHVVALEEEKTPENAGGVVRSPGATQHETKQNVTSDVDLALYSQDVSDSHAVFAHAHLHTATTPWAPEPDLDEQWRDQQCAAHKMRPIRCRMVSNNAFKESRHKPYQRKPQSVGWLHDMFRWECETTPQWVHVVDPGPVCPAFYMSDRNVCIPVEECVVFIDVENSRAFSLLSMAGFVSLLCAVTILLIVTLYQRRIQHNKQMAQELARRRARTQRDLPACAADRASSRPSGVLLSSAVVSWGLRSYKNAVTADKPSLQEQNKHSASLV